MIYLGEFKPGDILFYAANFHNDTGALEDPTSPEAQRRAPDGTWTALTAPAKQNAKTGHFGGTVDTTGFAAGQHVIRMAGVVATAKTVATEFTFLVVASTAKEVYDRVGAPAGASVSADIAAVKTDSGGLRTDYTTVRAGKIDSLDAAVSSRLATAGYTAPDNAGIAAIPTNPLITTDARLNNLDAAVSSRLATAGYTAPDNAGIAAIPTNPLITTDARLNNLDATVSSRLATAGYTAPDNAGIADAVWDEIVEGGLTARQLVRVMASALAGKAAGGGTTTVTFVGVDGVTTRITATVDANGNRSAVTINGA